MLKILLVGACGKMGKVVRECAKEQNIKIIAGVDRCEQKIEDFAIYPNFSQITQNFDVVLDFSHPALTNALASFCFECKKPLVVATTGHNAEQLSTLKNLSKFVPVFQSNNFSFGVNVFSKLVLLAQKLLPNVDIEMLETHHGAKADSPSGTALTLANLMQNENQNLTFEVGRGKNQSKQKNHITIHSIRGGTQNGKHQVLFFDQGETITISHEAHSKNIFALGAFKACEFVKNQKNGFYTMSDL